MYATFIGTVSATSNATANTEDVFIEFKNVTGGSQTHSRIRRVTVQCEAENSDVVTKVRIVRCSTVGATGAGITAYSKADGLQEGPFVSSTYLIGKNGSTNFTSGTITETISQRAVNGKVAYTWQSCEWDDDIVMSPGGIIAVLVSSSGTSINYRAEIEWVEPKFWTVSVAATSNVTANTEDEFIEFILPANNWIASISSIRIFSESASDAQIKARFCSIDSAGSGGTSTTPVRKNLDNAHWISSATYNIKNGTTAFTLGTNPVTFIQCAFAARDGFVWIASEDSELIGISGSLTGRTALIIQASQASIPIRAAIEFGA